MWGVGLERPIVSLRRGRAGVQLRLEQPSRLPPLTAHRPISGPGRLPLLGTSPLCVTPQWVRGSM